MLHCLCSSKKIKAHVTRREAIRYFIVERTHAPFFLPMLAQAEETPSRTSLTFFLT